MLSVLLGTTPSMAGAGFTLVTPWWPGLSLKAKLPIAPVCMPRFDVLIILKLFGCVMFGNRGERPVNLLRLSRSGTENGRLSGRPKATWRNCF